MEICHSVSQWEPLKPQLAALRLPSDQIHRKHWEWATGIKALEEFANPAALALGVGAGNDFPAFWLANRIHYVVATDLYGISSWQEANPGMLSKPESFSPFPYDHRRLGVMVMDGTDLRFPDNSFDIVFTYSSIEHFGRDAVLQAMQEIERVLKSGGVLSLTTELVLDGAKKLSGMRPKEPSILSEIFSQDEFEKYILDSTQLKLQGERNFNHGPLEGVIKFPEEVNKLPHIILDYKGIKFGSVHVLLKKI